MQERHLVGDATGFKDVLRHDDGCHAQIVPHVQQKVFEQLGAVGVQAGGWFVEEEQAWPQGEGARYRQTGRFPAGKRRGMLTGAIGDACLAQRSHRPLLCLGIGSCRATEARTSRC